MAQLVREAREVFRNPSLEQKDLLEWGSQLPSVDDSAEATGYLPQARVWAAVPISCDKR